MFTIRCKFKIYFINKDICFIYFKKAELNYQHTKNEIACFKPKANFFYSKIKNSKSSIKKTDKCYPFTIYPYICKLIYIGSLKPVIPFFKS